MKFKTRIRCVEKKQIDLTNDDGEASNGMRRHVGKTKLKLWLCDNDAKPLPKQMLYGNPTNDNFTDDDGEASIYAKQT